MLSTWDTNLQHSYEIANHETFNVRAHIQYCNNAVFILAFTLGKAFALHQYHMFLGGNRLDVLR